MIKEYDIDGTVVTVTTDENMLDDIVNMCNCKPNTHGICFGDYGPVVSKDIILSLYRYCVRYSIRTDEHRNTMVYNFMCSDKSPSDELIRRNFAFRSNRYVCRAFFGQPYSRIEDGCFDTLLEYERKYGDKDSYYNRVIDKLDNINELYLIDTEDCDIKSLPLSKKCGRSEFSLWDNNYSIQLAVDLLGNSYSSARRVFLSDMVDDAIFIGPFSPMISYNHQHSGLIGAGDYSAPLFISKNAVHNELLRIRDKLRAELMKSLKDCRLSLSNTAKIKQRLNVLYS